MGDAIRRTTSTPQRPATRGSVIGRRLGALSINSNAPFEAEVQSNQSNLVALATYALDEVDERPRNGWGRPTAI
jgi:hypothetical protein